MYVSLFVDVDSPCSEFDHGSPLHIAARNLAVESARVLLLNEADPFSRDFNGKTPLGKVYWSHSTILSNCFFG